MKIELRYEAGFWSLFVDGVRTVERESFAVADRVRYYLEHPEAHDRSESAEVAKAIRKWRATWGVATWWAAEDELL